MIQVDISALLNKLNSQSKLGLEQASANCRSRKNPEVTIEHLLFSFLDNPLADFRILLKSASIEHDLVHKKLAEALPRDDTHDTSPVFSPLLIELLQDAWLITTTDLKQESLRSGAIFTAALLRAERYIPLSLIDLFSSINRESLIKHFSDLTIDSSESEEYSESSKKDSKSTSVLNNDSSSLKKYCTDFTQLAKENKLDPVLSRDDEIGLMIDIICRRRKNNPIVVGDAGVGKSAVVEGLARRIIAKQVPKSMHNMSLLSLDLGLLQAGASVKGEFEKRLKGIIEEIKSSPTPIILFIDEAHTLIGAGNQEGGGDAANLLKPALARGELCTIAATTWKEYKKYFEKDPALTRRFQLVKLDEPTPEQTVDILRGLHNVYEKAHNVLISDDALKAASNLSARYVSGRQLPDKAIDVLDTACARIAINLSSPPKSITEIDTRCYQRQLEIDMLVRQQQLGQDYNEELLISLQEQENSDRQLQQELHQAWEKQQLLVENIIKLRVIVLGNEIQESPIQTSSVENNIETEVVNNDEEEGDIELLNSGVDGDSSLSIEQARDKLTELYQELETIPHHERLIEPEVNGVQIAKVIADWTGVPVDQMNTDELNKITNLPAALGDVIKGQDLAIKVIHKHMLTARADLRRAGRPKGAFLLVGPSGVGKTETVVQLAQQLYGGNQFLTTINMSEYQEKHTVSRLIGSPPGYVGFGEGGVLTEAIRKMPYSVVLLDEVEKAHPEVLNLFYQAFDKGELADGEGRVIDCQNVVFFMTSNLGYQTIVDYAEQPELLNDKLYHELLGFFKPALLARMEIVPYLPLTDKVLEQIIRDKLARLKVLLETRYLAKVTIDSSLVTEIMQRATRSENGARMLEAIIEGQMLPPVSLALLNKLALQEDINSIVLAFNDNEFIGNVS